MFAAVFVSASIPPFCISARPLFLLIFREDAALLTVDNISKSYGPFPVLEHISFSLNHGMRVGLVGANGSGKTTLIRIIAGLETADSGSLSLSSGAVMGYLPQSLPVFNGTTMADVLAGSVSGLRAMESRLRQMDHVRKSAAGDARNHHIQEYSALTPRDEHRGGYDLDHQENLVLAGLEIGYLDRFRLVDTLSGGEKTRLGLAVLLLDSPDVLLLDDPTNNLDTAALAWLENYLAGYTGAVLMASHDRQLLSTAANWIWEIDEHTHTLSRYPGNYEAYRTAKQQERQKWEEDYSRQQEEINTLKHMVRSPRMRPAAVLNRVTTISSPRRSRENAPGCRRARCAFCS